MRNFLISAAIITLIGGTSLAIAQDRGPDGGQRDRGGEQRGGGPRDGGGENRGARPAPQAAPQPAPKAAPNSGAVNGRNAIGERQFREHHDVPSPQRVAQPAPAQNPADAGQTMRGINRSLGNQPNAGRPDAGRSDNNNRSDSRGQNNRPDVRDRGGDRRRQGSDNRGRTDFNNGPRGPRRDYSNFRNYHQNYRATQRFRAPAYRRPQGFYARRWSWGETLPISFWARDYWLNDFNIYDLPPPPYGAVWVRVGDDALLIDQDSGEIIEVEYGIFY